MFTVSGKQFDVDAFLRLVSLKSQVSWHVGDTLHRKRPSEWSGFTLTASEAGFDDVWQQINDAIEFLKQHEADLARIVAFSGVDECLLDFGVEDRDVIHQADYFPAELLRLAGNLNIGLRVSRYPRTPDDAEVEGS